MERAEKLIITPKWEKIKEMFEVNTNNSSKYGSNFKIGGELDNLSFEFIELLNGLTLEHGYYCNVEGIPLDLWKERIWILVEKAGLLPEVAWKDDKVVEDKIIDKWLEVDNEWEFNIEDLESKIFNK
jgi:hypothetical protein